MADNAQETRGFGPDEAVRLVNEVFAPWVAAMGLQPQRLGREGAEFLLPANPDLLLRGGPGKGVLCGQALAAVADTACVLALAGANGRFRICTTTDLSVSFIRPIGAVPVRISVAIERNGKRLAVLRVTAFAEGSDKPAAIASATFMYLED